MGCSFAAGKARQPASRRHCLNLPNRTMRDAP
jgi:hypothetical protein